MKTFNNFNEMFNSNARLSTTSVFNGAFDEQDGVYDENYRYSVYVDDNYICSVYYYDNADVERRYHALNKLYDDGIISDYHYEDNYDVYDDIEGNGVSFWNDLIESWGGFNNDLLVRSIGSREASYLLERLIWVVEDNCSSDDRSMRFGDCVMFDVPMTKSESKVLADELYKTAEEFIHKQG